MITDGEITKTSVVYLNDICNFIVHHLFHSKFLKMILDKEMAKIEVVVFDEIKNFVFQFFLDSFRLQKSVLTF